MATFRLRTRAGAGVLSLCLAMGTTGCVGVGQPACVMPSGGNTSARMPAPAMLPSSGEITQVSAMAPNGSSEPNGGTEHQIIVEGNCQDPGCTSCRHKRFLGRGHQDGGMVMQEMPSGPKGPCPTELDRVSLPPYKVAPPDILFIDLIRMVPRPPYRVEPLEAVVVTVTDTLPNQPIAGPFIIAPDGTINLGFSYGSVNVGNMTLDQMQAAIRMHLGRALRNPQVTVALAQTRAFQQVRGELRVRPDGTISLGVYGSVYVAGLSLGQAKCVIEKHLSEYFLNPQISIDVFAYNSRVVYVIIDGGHLGQQVLPIPSTGNETVLDVISKVQGIAPVSSKKRIWVARPSPANMHCNQILPVDWRAITEAGSTGTNYQLFPGDRVYVGARPLIAFFDNCLSIVLAPVERVLGVAFLGASTANAFGNNNNNGTAAVVAVP